MNWFSKVTASLFPISDTRELKTETDELAATISEDRKIIASASSQPVSVTTPKAATPTSTLSPFASRILEKAKIESLKDDDERQKMTSPAQLFLTREEAKNKVGHIESIALERNKLSVDKFTAAAHPKAETQFNAFMKKAEKKDK